MCRKRLVRIITYPIRITIFLLFSTLCNPAIGENNISPRAKSKPKLEDIPYKIIYETFRKTEDGHNWELFIINADGSNPVNLTNTTDKDEMYPHVSPDGTKICFVADELNKIRYRGSLALRDVLVVTLVY